MNFINAMLDSVRNLVRKGMRRLAKGLDAISGGRVHPNTVTIIGSLAHIPIAWLIATTRNNVWAAILLIIFGLFDTLDGELARLQGKTSPKGMFLDSSTDRMKEIILYVGVTAAMVGLDQPNLTIIAVAALGSSLLTSYLNAWGDAVLAVSTSSAGHKANKSFRGGLLGFELRMSLLIVGLLFNQLEAVLYIILVLAVITVFQRLILISRRLQHGQ